MSTGRVLLVFTLAPVVLALERYAFYSARSLLGLQLSQLGLAFSEVGRMYTAQSVVTAICLLVGGALAIGIGPGATLVAGFCIALVGQTLLAFVDGSAGLWTSLILMGVGQGLFRPSLYALAAIELGGEREPLRNAAFVVLYAAVNVGALVAPLSARALANTASVSVGHGIAAGGMGLATLLAGGLALGWWFFRPRTPPSTPAPSPAVGRVLVVAAGLLVLAALFSLMLQVSSTVQFELARSVSLSTLGLVMSANPIAVLVSALIAITVCLVLYFVKKNASAGFFVAAGLCLGAVACLPLLLTPLSTAGSFATSAITGLAEVLFMPFALSRSSGDVPPRFTPAVLGVWFAVSTAVGVLGSLLGRGLPGAMTLLAALCAGLAFVLGGVLVFLAAPISRWLRAPLTPSDGAA